MGVNLFGEVGLGTKLEWINKFLNNRSGTEVENAAATALGVGAKGLTYYLDASLGLDPLSYFINLRTVYGIKFCREREKGCTKDKYMFEFLTTELGLKGDLQGVQFKNCINAAVRGGLQIPKGNHCSLHYG
jgi:hypothetical protein